MADAATTPLSLRRSNILRFGLTAAIGIAADLFTKWLAANRLSGTHVAIPDYLHFTYVQNYGAVFGLGQGKQILFVAVSVAAIGFVLYMFTRPPYRWWNDIVLGMLLGGIIGNLYDRVVFGFVRDMIHALPGFHWGGDWKLPLVNYPPPPDRAYFPWVFNIADSLLCVSIGILLVVGIFTPEPGKSDESKSDKP